MEENTNDEKLVEDYLTGNEIAFEKLLDRYLKPIYNFLFRIIGDQAVAEDLSQDTFLKVWKNLHKFDPQRNRFKSRQNEEDKKLAPYRTAGSGSGFRTWLFAIAKNTAFDYLKKKKEIPFSAAADEEGENWLENIADENFLPDELLERKDLAKEIEKILKKIPVHYRTILLLHYKEDFSLHEIAEILGEPYNTIKSRHQRGLISLKNMLEDNASEKLNYSY
jgi:RNA polymerase sigma-70 factor (ECF subfamily)